MQLWQALIIGALQGVSELFPVSSLAHTILIPALLGWDINQQARDFLAFVVALHLATAIALVLYFWKDWSKVILALLGSLKQRKLIYDQESKFAWLLVAGTVVVGIIGLVFESQIRKLFDDPKLYWIVGLLLVLNGGIMLFGEFLRSRVAHKEQPQHVGATTFNPNSPGGSAQLASFDSGLKEVEGLTFLEGGAVGAAQTLALLPGISRSGATMVAGLLAGLTHEAAARFSFMLATPVIGLAALLKVPQLFKPEAKDLLGTTLLAALLSGITAYISVRFLMRYFETKRLSPFGYYCIVFGLVAMLILTVRG